MTDDSRKPSSGSDASPLKRKIRIGSQRDSQQPDKQPGEVQATDSTPPVSSNSTNSYESPTSGAVTSDPGTSETGTSEAGAQPLSQKSTPSGASHPHAAPHQGVVGQAGDSQSGQSDAQPGQSEGSAENASSSRPESTANQPAIRMTPIPASAKAEASQAESTADEPASSPQEPAASGGASSSSDASQTAEPSEKRRPTAEELFPGSVIDRMTGDVDEELAAALGDMSMDDLMEGASSGGSAASDVQLDRKYPARVIKSDRESVFFTFAGQYEGMAPRRMFEELPAAGTEMEVIPTRYLTEDGLYEVIVPGGSVEVQDWSDLTEGVIVEAKITGHNKGGLECEVNHIRGFMPVSHIELYHVDDLESYVGQSLQCVVTEANEARRNLVVSRRAILEREREIAREKLLESLEPGQVVEGLVTRLQDFGAFVDLGGLDGLIHISQLSWDRVQHPREVLEEGQRVKVRVEKVDKQSGRVGLSYRDLLEDPWEDVDTRFPVGAIVEGVVSKIMEFGAFVKLGPGIEGLVHISEIAHHRITKVHAFLKEGQTVTVKVLSVDKSAQRISLSIKQALAPKPSDSQTAAEDAEGETREPAVPKSNAPLKGGLNRGSGGEQFGLKW